MTAPALIHPHRPTIDRTYTVTTKAGHKRTRTPEGIFTRAGVAWVRYTMLRGEVRCCTLDAWAEFEERAV